MAIKNTHSKESEKTPAIKEITEKHARIVDEFFANGMKKSAAVMTVLPDIKLQASAGALFNVMAKKPEVKKYMEQKNLELMESLSIGPEILVAEYMNQAFADPSSFVDIKCPEDIKKLTPSQRRQIKHWDFTEQTVTDPKGKKTTTKKISLRFKDSQNALYNLSKYVGLFSEHNKQKKPNVNINTLISNLQPKELNALLKVVELLNGQKTTDI